MASCPWCIGPESSVAWLDDMFEVNERLVTAGAGDEIAGYLRHSLHRWKRTRGLEAVVPQRQLPVAVCHQVLVSLGGLTITALKVVLNGSPFILLKARMRRP